MDVCIFMLADIIQETLRQGSTWEQEVPFKDKEFHIDGTQYEVTGTVILECYDDSDYDRESGYGTRVVRSVVDVRIDRIMRYDDDGVGAGVDVTNQPEVYEHAKAVMSYAAEEEDDHPIGESFLREAEGDQGELFGGGDLGQKPAVATVAADSLDFMKYPMFKVHQPAIGDFSQSSPMNMAKLLIFVICSQQTEWPRLNAIFPMFWETVMQTGSLLKPEEYKQEDIPKDAFAGIRWWAGRREAINFILNNRSALYSSIMRAVDMDERTGNTGFLVYRKLIMVPGLGVPKAGFATQLLVGKVGCVDSVNLNVLGTNSPTHIMSPSGVGFLNAKGISKNSSGSGVLSPMEFKTAAQGLPKDKRELLNFLYGELTRKSYEILRGYADYLDDLAEKGTTSEVLWNIWCGIIANKIHHFGGKPIDVKLPSQTGTSRVKSYKGSSPEHLQRAQARIRPWDQSRATSTISKDHVDLIRGESILKQIQKALRG